MEDQSNNTPDIELEEDNRESNSVPRGDCAPVILLEDSTQSTQEFSPPVSIAPNSTIHSAPVQNNRIILTTIIDQASEEAETEDDWWEQLCLNVTTRFKRIPNGGWNQILNEYKRKWNRDAKLVDAKNRYSRAKTKKQGERLAHGLSQSNVLPPITVADTNLYVKIKNTLLLNIEKLKSTTERIRTKKIYSQHVDNKMISILNTVCQQERIDESIHNLKQLNDTIYACQLTYEELSNKPKSEYNWRESIENKVSKLQHKLDIIDQQKYNEPPSQEMIQLCKSNAIHSNNEKSVSYLKDQIQEKIAVYQKKITVSQKRIEFRRENQHFEFNRRTFYRRLEQERNQIDVSCDKNQIQQFWKNIWTNDRRSDYEEMVELLPRMELTLDLSQEQMKKMIEEKISFLPNWRTPGPDQVYNFFIKKMTSLHTKLIDLVEQAIEDPNTINEEFYEANTYLIPKIQKTKEAKDMRPITCMPNLYKLLSKVMAELIMQLFEINELISINQMGGRRGTLGAKEQVLVSKILNQKYDNKLCTSWIDISKAYDSIEHGYLIAVLEQIGMPQNIINFVERTCCTQKTNLICGTENVGEIKIEKGLLQGDSVSPFLFIICIEPISRRINSNCKKITVGDIERNHLIFVDDIKLLAETKDDLEYLCNSVKNCLTKMGLQVNQAKSASNVESPNTFGDIIDGETGYKYLGVLEDTRNIIKEENKQLVIQKVLSRVEKLCQTKLNAVNFFNALNEFSISTLNYYIGLLPYEPDEYEAIDKDIRRILLDHHIIRNAANVERLYLKRNELGRGLTSIKDKAEIILLNLYNTLKSRASSRDIIKHEKSVVSHLGLIEQYLQQKYNIQDRGLESKLIIKKQVEHWMQRIKSKKMHSILYMDEEAVIDRKTSSLWLSKGNITPQHEGMLSKLQDRNLYFGVNSTCQRCKQGKKSVDHFATRCGRMLEHDYKKRHDEVVRCIQYNFEKKYGLTRKRGLKNYKAEKIVSNDRVKIKSDVPILTENINIRENKPDLYIHDFRKKEITLVEIGITNKERLQNVETTKSRKYEILANELRCIYPGTKVEIIPVVLTWDGLVTKFFKKYLKKLDINCKIISYIQSIVLKRTCESVLIDCRPDSIMWMEEEMANAMETLEQIVT